MFINQSFTKDKAVVNGKTVQIYQWISQPRFTLSKIYLLLGAAFGCKKFQILICSPLKMKSLHLLSKFHGYIFNGFREK